MPGQVWQLGIAERVFDRTGLGQRIFLDVLDNASRRNVGDEIAHLSDFAPLRINDLISQCPSMAAAVDATLADRSRWLFYPSAS